MGEMLVGRAQYLHDGEHTAELIVETHECAAPVHSVRRPAANEQ
jgi:hypothetical protein